MIQASLVRSHPWPNSKPQLSKPRGKFFPLAKTQACLERQDPYTLHKPVMKYFFTKSIYCHECNGGVGIGPATRSKRQ
jgi:hypothetical protein